MQDPLDVAIVAMAERRWGVLPRADLLEIGLGREALEHRVRHGRMHELHPGVYALGRRAISRRGDRPLGGYFFAVSSTVASGRPVTSLRAA